MLIEEQVLRAHLKCSEYAHRGGILELPLRLQYTEHLYTKLILEVLKDPRFDYKQSLWFHSRHLETRLIKQGKDSYETQENIRHAVLAVHEVFSIIRPNIYIPVYGAFDYMLNASRSNVKLRINSLHLANPRMASTTNVSRTKTLHAVNFVPFTYVKDMESDLISLLKVQTLGANTPFETKTTEAKLHLFGIGNGTEELTYTYIDYKKSMEYKPWLNYLEAPIKTLEAKYHYPLVPCPHSCQFKTNCFPTKGLK